MDRTNLSLLSVAALSVMAGKAMAQNSRPNIIYIMSDDHARLAISAYGSDISKLAPTPNIDRLAREGVRFDNAFVENSLSTPSRACLVTGLYSNQNGQRQLGEGIDSTKTFFTELLQKSGYTTAIIGKWHMRCNPKGFDYYHVLDDQGTYYNPVFKGQDTNGSFVREEGYVTDLITQHAIDFLEQRDKSKPFMLMVHHKAPHRSWLPDIKTLGLYDNVTFPVASTFYDDYATRGSAVRTQKMRIDKDMELALDLKVDTAGTDYGKLFRDWSRLTGEQKQAIAAYYAPRNEKFKAMRLTGDSLARWKYENYLRDYLNVIHSVDESVGEIYDYLKEHNLLDNTVIVYTSDNGFYLGEHGWFDKRFMYEESLRIPLVARYPKAIKPGTVSTAIVQNIDFAPTFLSIAKVKQPKEMSGLPLTRLFSGKGAKNWRTSLYYHYYDYPTVHMVRKQDGVRTERYKLVHFYGKGGTRAAVENKYQLVPGTNENKWYVGYVKSGYIDDSDPDINYNELYDLEKDPNELDNLYGKPGYEKITAELQKVLDKYRKDLKIDEW